jgi:hypothetical protein
MLCRVALVSSSETSFLPRATPRNIPEDAILHSHRRENLKSYIRDFYSASELYRPSSNRLSVKLVPTVACEGCLVVSAAGHTAVNFGFLGLSRYFFIMHIFRDGSRCSVNGSGPMLQAGRSWFRDPIR